MTSPAVVPRPMRPGHLVNWLAAAVVAVILTPWPAEAAKRVALVVGNASYEAIPALPNPMRDAAATRDALTEAGFEVVHLADGTLPAFQATLDAFAKKVEAAGEDAAAVVFYAGHAVQLAGTNYLLPIDVKPRTDADVPGQSVSLTDILKRLDATKARTKIVILDSCRDNPFVNPAGARGLALTLLDGAGAGPAGETGLARIESKGGTLVAFSTSPGATAADGTGEHSPFAAAFLKLVREPGLPVEQLFRQVRLAVYETTGGQQTPWETSSLTTPFSFFEGPPQTAADTVETTGSTGAAQVTTAALTGQTAAEAFRTALYWDTLDAYRLFLAAHPDDLLALRVHRILTLRQEEMAWAEAVRDGTKDAFALYLRLFPGSSHAEAAMRLAATAPERARLQLAAVCPAPAPALKPTKTKLTPAPAPKKTKKATTKPRRAPAPADDFEEPVWVERPVRTYDPGPAIAVDIIGGAIFGGMSRPRPPRMRDDGGYRPMPQRQPMPTSPSYGYR